MKSIAENVEVIRSRLTRTESSAINGRDGESIQNSPEIILAELLTLRKKYDAVVEYTVHLTAERDTIVSKLDELQREYSRELSRKKVDTPKGGSKGAADKAAIIQKVAFYYCFFFNFSYELMFILYIGVFSPCINFCCCA